MWGKTIRGRGMWNSRDAPHERWCYGNRGMHIGRYLVYPGLGYRIMSKDSRNAFPWYGLFNEWDGVVADGDEVCEH